MERSEHKSQCELTLSEHESNECELKGLMLQ